MDFESIRQELSAFADDDEELLLDDAGDLLMHRGGVEVQARLSWGPSGSPMVEIDGQSITYRDFLVRRLGQLDVLATRLVEKRPGVPAFVNASASLETADDDRAELTALEALQSQCIDAQGFRSRVCFITADAGQGKTALLKEFQATTASKFLAGESPFLFWHVDLQGRQLLRLSEALMGDLAELRVAGLWMPAILRMIRSRALVLAIDGFDELAAEQGGSDALGSLATLVQQMQGEGVVVAASRRAFFDTGDYLRRAGLFGRVVAEPCEFNQITLSDWERKDALLYLQSVEISGRRFAEPVKTYEEIVDCLGGAPDHPMVSKPFLLSHIARGLLDYELSPAEFVRPPGDPMEGVAAVVHAFVSREVTHKWIYRDSGEPYLSEEQHMRFLADVAEEMYRAGKDRLPLELVETLASMRLDEWGIDPDRQRQVMEMVRMHALLQPPTEADARHRSFDHPEFKDYFVAIALRNHLADAEIGDGSSGAAEYLSIAQVSDSSARYVRGMLSADVDLVAVARTLAAEADAQIRSTFLQVNAGTLIPALLNDVIPTNPEPVVGRAIYSSLVFEGTKLTNLTIERGTMLNVSLRDVSWSSVTLDRCDLGELTIHDDTHLSDVSLRDCRIEGVRRFSGDEEVERAYAPSRVQNLLADAGFTIQDALPDHDQLSLPDPPELAHARRFLQLFSRSNLVRDDVLERRFRGEHKWVIEEMIPVFVANEILEEKTWRGKGSHRIWVMGYPLQAVLEAEEGGKGELGALWDDLRSLAR